MAVAVLERNAETLEKIEDKIQLKSSTSAQLTADEQHNAKIGEIYQKLITPNAKVSEVLGRSEAAPVEAPRDIFAQRPVLVENARADAEIFRADSPVNRRVIDVQPQIVVASADEEEENEDLRPTSTTIQYKTTGVAKVAEEGKIENASEGKRALFTKKEKIVIAVVVSIVVAMFVLIVVNSAILSNMNTELSSLQSTLTTVKASFAGISDEFNSMFANAVKDAEDFALSKGMIK